MKLIDVAAGRESADLLIKSVNLIDVRAGEIRKTDIVIHGEKIAAVGQGYTGKSVIDGTGLYATPGFIEGHIHIESSMMTPTYFAQAVIVHGTTTVIADPHEIANVLGIEGVEFMIEDSKNLPVDIFFTAPSCVPATDLETSGAVIGREELLSLKDMERIIGLGEMMNYPGVYLNLPDVIEKLGIFEIQDGHAPMLSGKNLNAYIAAGIYSDHECTSIDEAREKLELGMHIMIREGTSERNLLELLPLVNNNNWPFFSFVSDDRHPSTIEEEGHLDGIIRKAVESGLDLVTAARLATINTARYFRLFDRGEIVPGKRADVVLLDESLNVRFVIKNGKVVVKDGNISFNTPAIQTRALGQMNFEPDITRLKVRASGKSIRVIKIIEGNLITKEEIHPAKVREGYVVSNPEHDILKLTVWERHKGTGNVGVGFVRGFGMKSGALASTVAHDSHNVIAVGVTDEDILFAVKRLKELGGGFIVVRDERELASLPLPVAGLMNDTPVDRLVELEQELNESYGRLGGTLKNPFMQLSFLALPVIPELKLTDYGLIKDFQIVGLFVDSF